MNTYIFVLLIHSPPFDDDVSTCVLFNNSSNRLKSKRERERERARERERERGNERRNRRNKSNGPTVMLCLDFIFIHFHVLSLIMNHSSPPFSPSLPFLSLSLSFLSPFVHLILCIHFILTFNLISSNSLHSLFLRVTNCCSLR